MTFIMIFTHYVNLRDVIQYVLKCNICFHPQRVSEFWSLDSIWYIYIYKFKYLHCLIVCRWCSCIRACFIISWCGLTMCLSFRTTWNLSDIKGNHETIWNDWNHWGINVNRICPYTPYSSYSQFSLYRQPRCRLSPHNVDETGEMCTA